MFWEIRKHRMYRPSSSKWFYDDMDPGMIVYHDLLLISTPIIDFMSKPYITVQIILCDCDTSIQVLWTPGSWIYEMILLGFVHPPSSLLVSWLMRLYTLWTNRDPPFIQWTNLWIESFYMSVNSCNNPRLI